MNAKHLVALAGLLMATAGSMPMASAVDRKTYPGALCQPGNSTLSISRGSSGQMFNTSTLIQVWTCPVVRERTGADAVDGIKSAIITVIDNNNTTSEDIFSRVSCALESRTKTGNLVETSTDVSHLGASPTPQDLNAYTNLASTVGGYYHFRCFIPGKDGANQSGIVSYSVDEGD